MLLVTFFLVKKRVPVLLKLGRILQKTKKDESFT